MSVDCNSQEINTELAKDNPDIDYIQYLRKQVLGYWPSLASTKKMIKEIKEAEKKCK